MVEINRPNIIMFFSTIGFLMFFMNLGMILLTHSVNQQFNDKLPNVTEDNIKEVIAVNGITLEFTSQTLYALPMCSLIILACIWSYKIKFPLSESSEVKE